MKILLVEDDLTSSMYLRGVITSQHHEVVAAPDGVAGLQAFEAFNPDLVFSDIRMPQMDGLTLLEKIRDLNPNVIVVMTSAYGQEEYTIKALRLKANDYLLKPLRIDQITHLLAKYKEIIDNRTIEQNFYESIIHREFTVLIGSSIEILPKIANNLMKETGNLIPLKDRLGVHLGLLELLINSIEHGNLGISFDEKKEAMESPELSLHELILTRQKDPVLGKRKVMIKFSMNLEQCEWTITDEGNGFNWQATPDPTSDEMLFSSHGRGIFLSRMQFDSLSFSEKGNSVTVKKRFLK